MVIGSTATTEYTYDNNGNLTKDSNKGIASITYNSLNLPSVVTFSNGSTVIYTYSADGKKLSTEHVISGTTTITNYAGNVVYENNVQKKLLTQHGYVNLTDSTHYFYIKDHLGNTRVVADEDGSAKEQNEYYPFGLNYTATTYQPYKYNGKELDTKGGLNWYDYGARHYDAALGRFLTVDPLAKDYYATSPYGYCLNNPVKFVDPTGCVASPIYDEYGNLLGTDDEGLTGSAIVMNESDFKQGMSHEEALKHNLGPDGLIDESARMRLEQNYNSLPSRPDYDGKLTLNEANDWYRNGNGKPLFVSLDKINIDGVLSLGENYVGETKSVNLLLNSSSINNGLVYGQITLKRYPNHQVRAYSDKYNFEMHSWINPINWGRNIETLIGRKVAGKGMPYEINIYGSKTLKPILPWIK